MKHNQVHVNDNIQGKDWQRTYISEDDAESLVIRRAFVALEHEVFKRANIINPYAPWGKNGKIFEEIINHYCPQPKRSTTAKKAALLFEQRNIRKPQIRETS